jgi:hypothetical protein
MNNTAIGILEAYGAVVAFGIVGAILGTIVIAITRSEPNRNRRSSNAS